MKYLMFITSTLLVTSSLFSMETPKEGLLIAIEGIDGSGKSTLAQNFFTTFQKSEYRVFLTKELGDTALGKNIRKLVQTQETPIDAKAEFLLFAADRAQHFSEVILPALTEKQFVVSDRLSDSSLAYQGYGRGLDLAFLTSINTWVMQNTKPDLTIFIRVPVKTALERIQKRNEQISVFEKESFLLKVANGFEDMYKDRTDVIIIDGTDSQENVTKNAFISFRLWLIEQIANKTEKMNEIIMNKIKK